MGKTLIVDDMEEVYEKLRRKFEEAEYSSNVADAKRKIASGEYEMVITDYSIGEGSPAGGLEIIREASKRGIECILMSTENHEEEALKAGATGFVFKKRLMENDREDISS